MRVVREKAREQKRGWRQVNPEKEREWLKRWRQANPEKFKAQRKRSREAENARTRRYHETHREERNRARREKYARQKGRSVPPPPPVAPPCDCGACLACGGWGASWKPAWHARLNAFCTKKDPPPCGDIGGVALRPARVGDRDFVYRLYLGDRQRVRGSSGCSARGRVGLRGGDGRQGRGSDASIQPNCDHAECLVPGLGGGGESHVGVLETMGVVATSYLESGCDCGGDVDGCGSHASAGSFPQPIGTTGLCVGRDGERGSVGFRGRPIIIIMNHLERPFGETMNV